MKLEAEIDLIGDKNDMLKIKRIKKSLVRRLKQTSTLKNQFQVGLNYFYLLRLELNSESILESDKTPLYYRKMNEAFLAHEADLIKECKDKTLRKDVKLKMKEFYQMMERCYSRLQAIFRDKDMLELHQAVYEAKMRFRKRNFFLKRQYWRWFEYTFLEVTSNYGDSFFRWGVTSFVYGLFMAGVYALLDFRLLPMYRIIGPSDHWFDYIYFSLVTLTSLGIGDFIPKTFLAKFFVSFEVFFGFIMLGIFVNLIQKKL